MQESQQNAPSTRVKFTIFDFGFDHFEDDDEALFGAHFWHLDYHFLSVTLVASVSFVNISSLLLRVSIATFAVLGRVVPQRLIVKSCLRDSEELLLILGLLLRSLLLVSDASSRHAAALSDAYTVPWHADTALLIVLGGCGDSDDSQARLVRRRRASS